MLWLCGLGGRGWWIERVLDSEFRGFWDRAHGSRMSQVLGFSVQG